MKQDEYVASAVCHGVDLATVVALLDRHRVLGARHIDAVCVIKTYKDNESGDSSRRCRHRDSGGGGGASRRGGRLR